jgi:hypothetical protein
MSFYQANLAVLGAGNAFLLYRQYKREHKPADRVTQPLTEDDDTDRDVEVEIPGDDAAATEEAVNKFKWDFFLVYALAVAADWLQVDPPFPSPSHVFQDSLLTALFRARTSTPSTNTRNRSRKRS